MVSPHRINDLQSPQMITLAASDPGQFLTEINHGLTAILRNSEWPILGVLDDAVYSSGECRISPLDLVMLYTDGLYEAENGDDEHFGRKRLMTAASHWMGQPVPQLFDGLLADVGKFTGSDAFADDVCRVGMEIMRVG
jgi:serine phosphatase RsbU (regulator of sigma subunit)